MMMVEEFVRKWTSSSRPEEAAAKEQFLNICSLLDHPQPVDLDPHAENFGLEKRVCISPNTDGFADAWKLGHFVWEYKTKHANLDKAYEQALKYRPGLRNPPLTVVSDMVRFRIYTEFTDTDQQIYEFTLEQLLKNEPSEQNRHRRPQEILYAIFYEPNQLRPHAAGTTSLLQSPRYRQWRQEQDLRSKIFLSVPKRPEHPFVGRDQLQKSIKGLLLKGSSVALTGIPGVGKTALASSLTADEEIAERYSSGVLWVRLGPEPDVLAQMRQLAIALHIPEPQINSAFEVDEHAKAVLAASTLIHTSIGARPFLIVVDDAWSTRDALAFKLGAQCVHIFTTRVVGVASSLGGEEVVIPELSLQESLALFTTIAPQATKWAPEDSHELVSATGGLPLALVIFGRHLKAEARRGRVRRLTDELNRLKQTQERLRKSMPLPPVEQYPSLAPATEVSLWTIINISYEVLPSTAGNMLASLGAFSAKSNDFDETAATTVSGNDIEQLDTLVEYGLLECAGDRYLIHQVIRDFALNKYVSMQSGKIKFLKDFCSAVHACADLEDIGLLDCRLAHAAYYLRFATDCCENRQQLRREWSQLYHAWQHVLREKDEDMILQYVSIGRKHLKAEGQWSELLVWLTHGIEAARSLNETAALGTLLADSAWVYHKRGSCDVALTRYEDALRLFKQVNLPIHEANVYNCIGLVHASRGASERAVDFYQQALKIGTEHSHLETVADARNNLAMAFTSQGRVDAAVHNLEEALIAYGVAGNREGEAHALTNLSSNAMAAGKLELALTYAKRGLAASEAHESVFEVASAANAIGVCYQKLGNYTAALAQFQRAISLYEQLGPSPSLALALSNVASLDETVVSSECTIDCLNRALAIQSSVDDDLGAIMTRCNLARHYRRLGQLQEAIAHAEAALALSLRMNVPSSIIVARETRGMVFEADDRLDESMAEYQAALSIANAVEDRLSAARELQHISALYQKKGDWSAALQGIDDALLTFQSSGATKHYAALLSQKGASLRKLGRYMEALQCYHSVLSVGKQLNDLALQLLAMTSVGTIRFEAGNYWGAVEAYVQTLQMANASANALAEATAHSNIACVYLSLFELDLALFHEMEAFGLYDALEQPTRKDISLFNLAMTCIEIARVQRTLGGTRAARSRLECALQYANEFSGTRREELRSAIEKLLADIMPVELSWGSGPKFQCSEDPHCELNTIAHEQTSLWSDMGRIELNVEAQPQIASDSAAHRI